ncbi:MAG: hypothetical protein Q9M24_00745 [Mariprofundaceae bacterium]|nr:hypothetical protein [Mariprofundaceae bacterium]
MSQTTLRGSCLCGSVQYEISGEIVRFYHCHCGRCRKATDTHLLGFACRVVMPRR